ncbi:Nucleic acid-binding protein [Corchorus olitorius]|uniref:Nucleic acid-binding protein n=1 Tax=Corchorus olitorius TaxID=93759 RepID=A0A1R3JLI3_9ROSI|nr:Nucleic acid-binding protein [Corchorus olitorius]
MVGPRRLRLGRTLFLASDGYNLRMEVTDGKETISTTLFQEAAEPIIGCKISKYIECIKDKELCIGLHILKQNLGFIPSLLSISWAKTSSRCRVLPFWFLHNIVGS